MAAEGGPEDEFRGRRVLLVEDQWLISMDMQAQLEDAGYSLVGPAPSLEKALALIEAERIDAAVLDVNLDGAMSYPAAEALAERGIPFAFLSGHTSAELAEGYRNHLLICKPVAPAELLAVVGKMIGGDKAGDG